MLTKIKQKESQIVSIICDYLAIKKYFFWRQNNIGVFNGKEYRKMPRYSKNGVPDIIAVIDGDFWGIEVKRPGGILSEDQKKFRDDLLRLGKSPNYYVVKSLDELIALGF